MSSLVGVKIRSAISGCTACHSVIITADGKAMTFGKNPQLCTELFGRGIDSNFYAHAHLVAKGDIASLLCVCMYSLLRIY